MIDYSQITTIAFDADDTLWVNEPIFMKTEEKCEEIIKRYTDSTTIRDKIYEFELKNSAIFAELICDVALLTYSFNFV